MPKSLIRKMEIVDGDLLVIYAEKMAITEAQEKRDEISLKL
jgi:hypothetical protein